MAKDLLLKNYDLKIANNDLAIDLADYQHVENLLATHPGHWKHSPILGVGIEAHLNGIVDRTLERKIKVALAYDGAKNSRVRLTQQGIEIQVSYE